ncbi:MAG: serine hydrolase domain-containing protein [Candidatus Thorarchaeota archaeon]
MNYNAIIEEFKQKIVEKINEGLIPGLSVAIITKEEDILLQGFGFTDISKKQAVDENTLFGLQSTTKTITSVAFLLAMEKGLVNIDDLIIKYYPEFSINSCYGNDEYKKITFRHLLSHTSGLPREARIGGCFSPRLGNWKEHIESLKDSWMNSPVGTSFSYSNIGMDLVAFILEKITGQPYYEFLQQELGNPLGITFHWFMDEIYSQPNAAKGYIGKNEAHKLDEMAYGCGGAFLSIKEQATFVRFLLNKGKHDNKVILKENYFELLRTIDGTMGYGLGTEVSNRFGIRAQNHAGGGFGLCSEMFWIPEQNLGVALFHNNEDQFGDMKTIIEDFIRKYLEMMGIDSKPKEFPYSKEPIVRIRKEKLRRLEGLYQSYELSYQIKVIEGKLYLLLGSQKRELKPHSETIFSSKPGEGLVFLLDTNGEPTGNLHYHLKLGILENKYLGKLREEQSKARENWKKYVGLYIYRYYYTEYFCTYITLDENGYLFMEFEKLYPTNIPNVFSTYLGITAIFDDNSFYHDNILYTKIEHPVEFYKELIQKDKKSRALVPWMIDRVIEFLEKLDRKIEAEELKKITTNI